MSAMCQSMRLPGIHKRPNGCSNISVFAVSKTALCSETWKGPLWSSHPLFHFKNVETESSKMQRFFTGRAEPRFQVS